MVITTVIALIAIAILGILTYKYGLTKAMGIIWAFLAALIGAVAILWDNIVSTVPPGV